MGWIYLAQLRVKNLGSHAGQDFKNEEMQLYEKQPSNYKFIHVFNMFYFW